MTSIAGCAAATTIAANAVVFGFGMWWGSNLALTVSLIPIAASVSACCLWGIYRAGSWFVVAGFGIYVVIQYSSNTFGEELWNPSTGWWGQVPGVDTLVDWFTDIARQIPHFVAYLNLIVGLGLGLISLLFWTLKTIGSSFGKNSRFAGFAELADGHDASNRVGEAQIPLVKLNTAPAIGEAAATQKTLETRVVPAADPPPSPPGMYGP